jgi:DNA repair protein RadC
MQNQLPFSYIDERPLRHPRRRVCDMPLSERPLYRLQHFGTDALATMELLALAIGGAEAPGLAEDLLTRFGSLHQLVRAGKAQLTRIRGIGEAQAGRLIALLELSRRLQEPAPDERLRVTSPSDAANLLMPRLRYLEQEEFHVVLLDTRNRVMKVAGVYKGSLNTSVIRVGEIFRLAIEMAAAAVIVAHNHPSGLAEPSPEDVATTRQLVEAGKLLDISVLDHLIVGDGRFVSLKERHLGFD